MKNQNFMTNTTFDYNNLQSSTTIIFGSRLLHYQLPLNCRADSSLQNNLSTNNNSEQIPLLFVLRMMPASIFLIVK